jgi:hypothetical protein
VHERDLRVHVPLVEKERPWTVHAFLEDALKAIQTKASAPESTVRNAWAAAQRHAHKMVAMLKDTLSDAWVKDDAAYSAKLEAYTEELNQWTAAAGEPGTEPVAASLKAMYEKLTASGGTSSKRQRRTKDVVDS